MTKKILVLLSIVLVSGCVESFMEQELSFETITEYNPGHDRAEYVIKNDSEWSNLSDFIRSGWPDIKLPFVNFTNEMVIAIFQGIQPSGGYDIKITKIIEKEASLEVFVKETSPSGVASMMLTSPGHIVKTKRVDKEVIFIKED